MLGSEEYGLTLRDLLTVLALLISGTSFIVNYRHTRQSLVLGRKPVIVFEFDNGKGWTLRNVGNGPALNVVVAEKKEGRWIASVKSPAVGKDGALLLSWLGQSRYECLGAIYTDPEGNKYTSFLENGGSRIEKGFSGTGWEGASSGWNHVQG